jgi:catechol 2,3-dioxygenase-like lactoylglutathione lyase family enzyme
VTVLRLEHVGIVVDDLAAATAFFVALGLEVEGEASVEGGLVDRINGLAGVRADVVILRTPDDGSKLELAKYRSPSYEGDDGPAPANAPGIRHVLFVVDDIEASLAGLRAHGGELVGELVNYEDSYWLCYVRGPAGIIVELAEKIGGRNSGARAIDAEDPQAG